MGKYTWSAFLNMENNFQIITVSCPCCKNNHGQSIGILSQKLTKYGLDICWETEIIQCSCGSVYQKYRPANLDSFYSQDSLYQNKFVDSPESISVAKVRLERLLEYTPHRQGKILDVGAGAGHFAALAAETFETVTAMELNGELCRIMEAKGVCDVLCMNFFDVHMFKTEGYDVVTAYDVLEHVSDPVALMKRCYDLLAPDGLVVFCTQDPEHFDPLKDFSNYPEHFFSVSRHQMVVMFNDTGFEPLGHHWDESPVRSSHRDPKYLITYFGRRY
jgi:predicted TPR repeat methyltransferase